MLTRKKVLQNTFTVSVFEPHMLNPWIWRLDWTGLLLIVLSFLQPLIARHSTWCLSCFSILSSFCQSFYSVATVVPKLLLVALVVDSTCPSSFCHLSAICLCQLWVGLCFILTIINIFALCWFQKLKAYWSSFQVCLCRYTLKSRDMSRGCISACPILNLKSVLFPWNHVMF